MSLSTNWRSNAGTFISNRDGDDTTGNGSQASPYKTLSKVGNNTAVLRSGYYTGSAAGSGSIIGDGVVFWDAFNVASSRIEGTNFTCENVVLQNHSLLRTLGGFIGSKGDFINCVFDNVLKSGYTEKIESCLIQNNSRINTAGRFVPTTFYRCTFISSIVSRITDTGTAPAEYTRCFFSKNMIIQGNVSADFNNCCFESNGTQTQVYGTGIKDITLLGNLGTIGNIYSENEKFSGTATVGGESVTFVNCFYTDNAGFIPDTYYPSTASPLVNSRVVIGKYNPCCFL